MKKSKVEILAEKIETLRTEFENSLKSIPELEELKVNVSVEVRNFPKKYLSKKFTLLEKSKVHYFSQGEYSRDVTFYIDPIKNIY